MKALQASLLLTCSLPFLACGSTSPAVNGAASPDAPAVAAAGAAQGLELTIKPAAAEAQAGQRLPLQFTLHNPSDRSVRVCLSPGRVVHLWSQGQEHAYTLAKQDAPEPSCEQPIELLPHAKRSWTEEITIPAIAATTARLVGFAQVVQPESCEPGTCEAAWLSASFSPFKVDQGQLQSTLDLRTGADQIAAARSELD
ncbi:MAG TPA: hypothetical protein VHN15_09975 [Thermoanaerobaculia bacterium]|nr:hypothetical protein [Thermoanaerobaculia bacterium]